VKSGIIIVAELQGPAREKVAEIQRRFDPKLAKAVAPHVTITGSSGMGPIATRTSATRLRAALEPVARATAPMTLTFGRPMRFMQTNVVVLPLDPNGPVRALHERIKRSGLTYERERFTFTPHATLSFFPTLEQSALRELLAFRVDDPITLDHIAAFRTVTITETKELLRLPLTGRGA